jgi:hypothetical protein
MKKFMNEIITKPTKGITIEFNKQKNYNQNSTGNPIIYSCFIYGYILKP